jgi:UDPglucose 6-dehydrogenase
VNICMIGAGYVGLVSAVCFSEFGWTVNCVDLDADKIARLRRGEIPIYEPGLEELLARNAEMGRLHFFTELAPAVRQAELIFLAVGTPMRRGDGYADLSYVYAAVEEMAPHLSGFTVVTTKSTVRAAGSQCSAGRRFRRLLEPGIFARRLRDPGFYPSRPRAGRRR